MELCPMLHASLDGRSIWGRMDTCTYMGVFLCCLPEIITTLLISYTPIYKKKFKFKKSNHKSAISPPKERWPASESWKWLRSHNLVWSDLMQSIEHIFWRCKTWLFSSEKAKVIWTHHDQCPSSEQYLRDLHLCGFLNWHLPKNGLFLGGMSWNT